MVVNPQRSTGAAAQAVLGAAPGCNAGVAVKWCALYASDSSRQAFGSAGGSDAGSGSFAAVSQSSKKGLLSRIRVRRSSVKRLAGVTLIPLLDASDRLKPASRNDSKMFCTGSDDI